MGLAPSVVANWRAGCNGNEMFRESSASINSSSCRRRYCRSAQQYNRHPRPPGTSPARLFPPAEPCARSGRLEPTRRFFSPAASPSCRANNKSTLSQCSFSTTPGAIAWTLMPCLIKSRPALCVRLITAALDAQYTATRASPRRPAREAKLMILPPSPWAIRCPADCAERPRQ